LEGELVMERILMVKSQGSIVQRLASRKGFRRPRRNPYRDSLHENQKRGSSQGL